MTGPGAGNRRMAAMFAAVTIGAVAALVGACSPSRQQGGPVHGTALTYLHVVVPSAGVPYLADPAGRRVILRGVAASGFEDQDYSGAAGTTPHYPATPGAYSGSCPVNDGRAPDPPVCEVDGSRPAASQSSRDGSRDDFAQMKALGFDLVRVTLNWSLLEPDPGRYSGEYLDRIAQVVGWAKAQGIYVLLDMHQDGYSRFLAQVSTSVADPPGCQPGNGQDGAPLWATITDGRPACSLFGQNQLDPAMADAFGNFWDNRSVDAHGAPFPQGASPGLGLQDHYIGALASLARRFSGDPTVVGYEIMNEPLAGSTSALPLANQFAFSDADLYPFYQRAIEALTGVRDRKASTCPESDPAGMQTALTTSPDPAAPPESGYSSCAYPDLGVHVDNQSLFFEPTGFTNLSDFAPQFSQPFTQYPNIVFAPHVYTHVFTIDGLTHSPVTDRTYPPSFEFGYQTASYDATAMHSALLVTEYGDAPTDDGAILSHMIAAQERSLSGSVFWTWKENCGGPSPSQCANGWGIYQPPPPSTTGSPAQNGPLSPSRSALLDRAWPMATAGSLLGYAYDPATASFAMEATSHGSLPASTAYTEIYLPPAVAGPVATTGSVSTAGTLAVPTGGRIVTVSVNGKGVYTVSAGRKAATVLAAALAQAASPPLPIEEVQARRALEGWIASLRDSSRPGVAGAASLLSVLDTTLLGLPGTDPNIVGALPALS